MRSSSSGKCLLKRFDASKCSLAMVVCLIVELLISVLVSMYEFATLGRDRLRMVPRIALIRHAAGNICVYHDSRPLAAMSSWILNYWLWETLWTGSKPFFQGRMQEPTAKARTIERSFLARKVGWNKWNKGLPITSHQYFAPSDAAPLCPRGGHQKKELACPFPITPLCFLSQMSFFLSWLCGKLSQCQ
jgi:hypothetical protein